MLKATIYNLTLFNLPFCGHTICEIKILEANL